MNRTSKLTDEFSLDNLTLVPQTWYMISMFNSTEEFSPSPCLGTPHHGFNNTFTATGYSFTSVIAISILVGIFCLYVLLGNIAVIVIICTDRTVASQTQNQYLISLAAADALLSVMVVPFTLVNELMGSWPFGQIYCQFYLALDVLLCTASIWNICAIGVDRYWSVNTPISNRKKRTKKAIRIVILLVWAMSFLISVPPFIFGFKTIRNTHTESCFINDETWYILFSSTLSFFLPAIIIAPVYTRIYQIGRRYARPSSERVSFQKEKKGQDVAKQHNGTNGRRSSCLPNIQEDANEMQEQLKIRETQKQVVCNLIKASMNSEDEYQEEVEMNDKCYDYELLYPKTDNKVGTSNESKECSVASTILNSATMDTTLSSKKIKQRERVYSNTSTHSGFSVMSFVLHFRKRSSESRDSMSKRNSIFLKRERRFIFIICLVTGGFIVCWYPFFQTYVIYALCGSKCCINKTVFKLIFWLGYMNSGLNPAIYTIFNKDFRRAFRRLILRYTWKS